MRHFSSQYLQWLNDAEVCQDNRHAVFPHTAAQMKKYIESASDSGTDHVFAICLKKNNKHVGNVSVGGISWINRSCEIAVLLGEKEVWGQGIGTEACQLVLDYIFSRLNLNRVRMGMTTRNKAIIQIAKKLGMSQEGIFKQALFKNGEYLDVVQFAIFNSHSRSLKKGRT